MAARRTRRSDTEPPARAAAKGLAVVALMAVLGWIAVSAYNGVPGRGYRTMYAEVPQIGNLIQHDQVRIAGVRVGQVLGTTVARDGSARLRLQLEPGTRLPADTRIAVRANGLLGARYVQLIPGRSADQLPDRATVHGSASSLTPGVTDALDAFDARTRGALGDLIGGLGTGLLGQSTRLNDTIRINARVQPEFLRLVDTILARPGAVQRLLPSLGSATAALDGAGPDLVNGFGATADALAPVAERSASVRDIFEVAPSALAAADQGLRNGRRLLGAARSLATSAARTLPGAPAGLRAATALLRDSHVPLSRADALLQDVPRVVPAVLLLGQRLGPVLGPLDQALGDLTPMVRQIGRYGCNITNLGAVFRSMTGFGGTGEGPGGPAMQFRLQSIPSQESIAMKGSGPNLITRDGYPAPCKYVAAPYPLAVGLPHPAGGGR